MKMWLKFLALFLFATQNIHAGVIDWIKCPWTWGAVALSAVTVKIGHYAYLSKKKETTAKQIDRARDNLRLENETSAQTLHNLRSELAASQMISQESLCTAIMRRIGYPYDEEFAKDLALINETPQRSPLNKPRVRAVEKHLHRILGNAKKQLPNQSPHVPKANQLHKRQLKTLAWGTATVACAIAAGECWTQSCQK